MTKSLPKMLPHYVPSIVALVSECTLACTCRYLQACGPNHKPKLLFNVLALIFFFLISTREESRLLTKHTKLWFWFFHYEGHNFWHTRSLLGQKISELPLQFFSRDQTSELDVLLCWLLSDIPEKGSKNELSYAALSNILITKGVILFLFGFD